MKARFLGSLLIGGALLASAAGRGSGNLPKSDSDITKSVVHEIRMYPRYSIWDDINFRVANGQVMLSGEVTQPVKKSDLQNIVERIPGVTSVDDRIRVLPLSPQDEQLRLRVANAIYRDPSFTTYAMEALPSIHIIVENGHVTLTGLVRNEFDKNLAGMRAASAGLSFGPIVNHLQVETSAKS
jgi:hyperosmotically inducible protein